MRGKQANAIRCRNVSLILLPLLLVVPGWAGATSALPPVVYDFVEKFPTAEVQTDTKLIKFTAADSRDLLIAGWAMEPKNEFPARWGIGDESSLRFFVSVPTDLNIRFRCWPFHFKDSPEQRLTIVVNGHKLDEIPLRTQPSVYDVTIPRTALLAGSNLLAFRYAYSRAPSDLNPAARNRQPLAVSWDWLQIGSGSEPSRPTRDSEAGGRALNLPVGSRLDYFTKIGPDTALTIDDIVPFGTRSDGARAQLRLELATGSSAPRELTVPAAAGNAPRVIPLPVPNEEVVRISFQALGNAPRDAGWRIVQPMLRARDSSKTSEAPAAAALPQRKPNIIVYLIDTLRADHLGCYGYSKPISPNIDAFAKDGIRFAAAQAQSSHTKPSVTSIFTGLPPRVHGLQLKEHALPEETVTLAEVVKDAGYDTAGFVTNIQISPDLGFNQGFDVYEFMRPPERMGMLERSERVTARALSWLGERRSGRPFFLYLHTIDPHSPYTPPKLFRERFAPNVTDPRAGFTKEKRGRMTAADREYLVPLYDAEIAANDDSFGELIRGLKKDGLYDSSLILLIADHGEEFYDHGRWEHGGTLYQEVVHVPLILKLPGQQAADRVVTDMVQQIDVLPTIAAVAGGEVPPGVEGRNLLALALGTGTFAPPFVVAYRAGPNGVELESAVSGHTKLIRNIRERQPPLELYDLERDPEERNNLATDEPLLAGYLRGLLAEPQARAPAPRKVQLDEFTQERLRALGY